MILQSEAAECGLACLAMIAGYHGYETDLLSLRQRFALSLRGATLKSVIEIASALDMAARPIRIELDELQHVATPCVLHWNMNHFVVLKKVVLTRTGAVSGVLIHDPGKGLLDIALEEVSRCFTGIALELTPTPGFQRKQEKQRLHLSEMVGRVVGLLPSIGQILLLALALEAFALVTPFFMQWVVDSAILSADRSLLAMLALGFGLLLLVQTALGVFRSWTVLYMSTHLNFQWVGNVFTHLLRLPMDYFEKRHLGDVVSRFNAIQAIQHTLSIGFVEALLDGLLAVTTLTMLFIYSVSLAMIVLLSIALYGLLRWVMYRPLRRATEEQISLQAREQSLFLESIRGIQTIKLFNHEDERRSRWLNALAAAVNRSIVTQKITLAFTAGQTLIAGAENILIIWLGALLVMGNVFSVGMLYAFIAYKITFTTRIYSLIDKWQELKMLSLQGERLADIVLTPQEGARRETDGAQGVSGSPVLPPARQEIGDTGIEVRNLSFRYSEQEPWIIKNLNLHIRQGESLALVGASGCGKTTLLKLLLGLLSPSEGEVLIGGISLARLGQRNYRALIGAVMQDDQLLSGSIADNICFFDLQADRERIEECARMAAIAGDIKSMPMGYQTLIGDMGNSLSGGQKQRILLARALYKRPQILFLDEATSHLDVTREVEVNRAIGALSLTRVIVAHRPETIHSAERIVELVDGEIVRDLRKAPEAGVAESA
ncbi:MAG TPA: peptidase domain-containing ABC transporter [Burkholderiaceae bacterium]